MKIVVLDGYTENPGDLSWDGLKAFGELTVYDRVSYEESPKIAEAIGDAEVITCRPADLLEPELDKYREEIKDRARKEEDVLSYALFPQVATKFFDARDAAEKAKNAPAAVEEPEDENAVREVYVEDLTC